MRLLARIVFRLMSIMFAMVAGFVLVVRYEPFVTLPFWLIMALIFAFLELPKKEVEEEE